MVCPHNNNPNKSLLDFPIATVVKEQPEGRGERRGIVCAERAFRRRGPNQKTIRGELVDANVWHRARGEGEMCLAHEVGDCLNYDVCSTRYG